MAVNVLIAVITPPREDYKKTRNFPVWIIVI